jgi:hypothetical protein
VLEPDRKTPFTRDLRTNNTEMRNSIKAPNPRAESSGTQRLNPWRRDPIRRKPIHSETPKQSRAQEENQTDHPNRNQAESPNPTKNPKRYNLIPHLIALCVILATNRSAYALSFNLNTDIGDITNGTITLTDNGPDPRGGPYENYVVDAISGTFDGQTISEASETYFGGAVNSIEIDSSGNILVTGQGISFVTNSDEFTIFSDEGTYDSPYALATGIYQSSNSSSVNAQSFTETQVPFQAPQADAIPLRRQEDEGRRQEVSP